MSEYNNQEIKALELQSRDDHSKSKYWEDKYYAAMQMCSILEKQSDVLRDSLVNIQNSIASKPTVLTKTEEKCLKYTTTTLDNIDIREMNNGR